jgi:uncharacterized protein YegL
MKKNFTKIAFILDESGSMYSLKNDTIGNFNSFVEEQKKVSGECELSIVKFSDNVNIQDSKNLKNIEKLTDKDYSPNGCTALLDAIRYTINKLGTELNKLKEEEKPENVIIVILTDGEENSSKEFNNQKIKEMIQHQENKYNWTFLYLGANQDAFSVGNNYGISTDRIMNYSADVKGLHDAYNSISYAVTSKRSNKDFTLGGDNE